MQELHAQKPTAEPSFVFARFMCFPNRFRIAFRKMKTNFRRALQVCI
jgi:hypothetical protein